MTAGVAEGNCPMGDDETDVAEGNCPIGADETDVLVGNCPMGEENTDVAVGNCPMGDDETAVFMGEAVAAVRRAIASEVQWAARVCNMYVAITNAARSCK